MNGEGKSGISMIKQTSFYSSESDKTKLKKHKISDEALAEFSIYISKEMKDIILQKLSSRIEKVYFSYEMIESYFPNLSDKLVNKMLDAISKTWDTLLGFCEVCPSRCISEKDAYCTMFNDKDLF